MYVQYVREELKSRNAPREGDFIGGVRRWNQSPRTPVTVHQRYVCLDWTRLKKILPDLHLRDCGTERLRSNTYLQSPLVLGHSGSSDGMLRGTCYVWHPQICSRYYDHDGTESRICVSEEKSDSSFRTSAWLRAQEGKTRDEEDGRSELFCENATGLFFCRGWSRARSETRKSKEGEEKGIGPEGTQCRKKEPQIRG